MDPNDPNAIADKHVAELEGMSTNDQQQILLLTHVVTHLIATKAIHTDNVRIALRFLNEANEAFSK